MRKELVKEFSMRVTQASRSELIVIMYEIILKDIEYEYFRNKKTFSQIRR